MLLVKVGEDVYADPGAEISIGSLRALDPEIVKCCWPIALALPRRSAMGDARPLLVKVRLVSRGVNLGFNCRRAEFGS